MIRVRLSAEAFRQFEDSIGAGDDADDLTAKMLETLDPEAKRELAAQLLRSASRAEGYEG